MIRLPALLLSLALWGSGLSAQESVARPLDPLVTGEAAWAWSTAQFEQQFQSLRFDWLSDKKDQARFFGPGLSLWQGSVPLKEAIVEFSAEGRPARLNFSIYNRGDAEALIVAREAFEARLQELRDLLSRQLGVQPVERGKDRNSAVAAEGLVWSRPPSAFLLEYSFQREVKSRGIPFQAEFIRLRVAPVGGSSSGLAATANATVPVGRGSLTANVTRADNGDVVISGVPMVDQGPKGYCAVATAERVFKYYGLPVDQHEMAQIAGSSSDGGTSPDKMYAALNKLEGRLGVSVRVIEDWDFRKFMDRVADYNREAKKARKPEVDASPRNGVIYID